MNEGWPTALGRSLLLIILIVLLVRWLVGGC